MRPTIDQDHVEVRGARVPSLGFGTFQLEGQTCEDMVCYALDLGYRHVDTAEFYGNEESVGRGLRASSVPRDDVWVTTKVWRDNLGTAAVKSSADECLRRLGLDHVDLLLIHWPHDEVPLGETLGAFRELQEAGKARHIGVSNFPSALLKQAIEGEGAPVFCDQVEYHVMLSQDPVLEYARDHDVMVTAYSPLARGDVVGNDTLRAIGKKHGKTAAQVSLRWLLDQDKVSAIPKASSQDHCKANFEVFDFTLDAEDRAAIAGLPKDRRQIDPGFAPTWD